MLLVAKVAQSAVRPGSKTCAACYRISCGGGGLEHSSNVGLVVFSLTWSGDLMFHMQAAEIDGPGSIFSNSAPGL